MTHVYMETRSPLGRLVIVANERGLTALGRSIDDDIDELVGDAKRSRESKILLQAKHELDEYFQRRLKKFRVPLHMDGTPFQRVAWEALCRIPYGRTISYGEQAREMGKPLAVRAVGAANGRNKIGIIVPCHRVIGSDGSLTGYGGGLPMKQFLLELEGAVPQKLKLSA